MTEPEMKTCPFCAGGETRIDDHTYWTGMRSDVLSVTLRHWCVGEDKNGFNRITVSIRAKTREEAIKLWNDRIREGQLEASLSLAGAGIMVDAPGFRKTVADMLQKRQSDIDRLTGLLVKVRDSFLYEDEDGNGAGYTAVLPEADNHHFDEICGEINRIRPPQTK